MFASPAECNVNDEAQALRQLTAPAARVYSRLLARGEKGRRAGD
jgi:hypothetical protein